MRQLHPRGAGGAAREARRLAFNYHAQLVAREGFGHATEFEYLAMTLDTVRLRVGLFPEALR